jgi:hypothetical protein
MLRNKRAGEGRESYLILILEADLGESVELCEESCLIKAGGFDP